MQTLYNTLTITPKDSSNREVYKPSVCNISGGLYFEDNMIIYKATNLINGKMYIGQTVVKLQKRKCNHLSATNKGSQTYFHRAIRKYGKENFKWQVICICPNIDILNEQEQYYIKLYDSMNNGYNLNKGGDGQVGFKVSDKTKKLLRDANLGKTMSYEARQKISKAFKGDRHPLYGKHHSIESNEKNRISHLGMKHTEEAKKKIGIASKKYWKQKKEKK